MLLSSALCSSTVHAQMPFLTWTGSSKYGQCGYAVAGLGDIDGDGYGDVAFSLPGASLGGRVEVHSGSDGHVLYFLNGTAIKNDYLFGAALCALGDIDGDSVPDLAVGHPDTVYSSTMKGKVHIYSGAHGAPLYTLVGDAPRDLFGISVADVGDLDGDGSSDLLVGAPQGDLGLSYGPGYARLFSGKDGHVLMTLNGSAPASRFGWSVASAGDVDGDGVPDVLVGAPFDGTGSGPGKALVCSGASGTVLLVVNAGQPGEHLGWAVLGSGDLNGDGQPDVVTGSPYFHDDSGSIPYKFSGRAALWSGQDASLLWDVQEPGAQTKLGYALDSFGDINGDGRQDIAVGAPNESVDDLTGTAGGVGGVRVLSGANGRMLRHYRPVGPFVQLGCIFGSSLSGRTDVDGDGSRDLIVGMPDYDPSGSGTPEVGRTQIYSGKDAWLDLGFQLSAGFLDQSPGLLGGGPLTPDSTFTLSLFQAIPFSHAMLVIGGQTAYLPYKGGIMVPLLQSIDTSLVCDVKGSLTYVREWPAWIGPGHSLYFQAWVANAYAPSGITATNAVSGTSP